MYVLIAPIEQVMISMSFLFLPALAARYSAQNQEAFVSFWRKWALLVLGVTSIFALGVRLTGTRLLHLLYAGKFDELGPLLFLLALVPLCMGIGNTAGDAIRAAEKPHLVFYAYVSSAIATFLIGIPLVIFFGLRGAAWGMIVSASTYSIALLIAFRLRVYRTRPMIAVDAYSSTPTVPSLEDI
jgi:O-antigen/teichoic acid export membrane protein